MALPNEHFFSTMVTLKVICDIDSFVLDFSTITISPSTDLVAKLPSDTSDLTFELSGLVNEVTGCVISSVELYSLDDPAG